MKTLKVLNRIVTALLVNLSVIGFAFADDEDEPPFIYKISGLQCTCSWSILKEVELSSNKDTRQKEIEKWKKWCAESKDPRCEWIGVKPYTHWEAIPPRCFTKYKARMKTFGSGPSFTVGNFEVCLYHEESAKAISDRECKKRQKGVLSCTSVFTSGKSAITLPLFGETSKCPPWLQPQDEFNKILGATDGQTEYFGDSGGDGEIEQPELIGDGGPATSDMPCTPEEEF